MNDIFFSIIVASFNAGSKIRTTIDSVLTQTFDNYEIIVKDGGSTDNTLSQVPESDKIRVYTNKDGGIYYGMNEGIDYAQGRYICFLNCGDIFYDKYVLETVYETAVKCDSQSVVYGDLVREDIVSKQPRKLSSAYLINNPLCHQSMFISRDVFLKHGKYDPTIKICADWYHLIKTFKSGVEYVYCDKVICVYESGGASETKSGIEQKKLDRIRLDELFTKKEVFVNKLYLFFSFVELRKLILSDSSPKWLRKFYKKIANIIKH